MTGGCSLLCDRFAYIGLTVWIAIALCDRFFLGNLEVLSILLGVSPQEIQKLDDFSEIKFSEVELDTEEINLKKKIEDLAKQLDTNTQKIELLLQSIPQFIDLAIEKSKKRIVMFHDMVRVALKGKELSLLKKKIEEDARQDPSNAMTWKEFEDILNGALPIGKRKLETFVSILDSEQNFKASVWRAVWESENINLSDSQNKNHVIRNGN